MNRTEPGARNARELLKAERRNRWYLFGSGLPALLLVLLTFVLPIGWLFWLSLFDANGQLTVENYTRLLEPIYVLTFVQTFKISIIVTVACVLIGYPYAYFMIKGSRWLANLAMGLLLVSLWTSLLVRTYAWLIILQRRGMANDLLMSLGLTDVPLSLVHNLTGTVIGMVHIMLPFMILPLFASMKSIDPIYNQAAAAFGAAAFFAGASLAAAFFGAALAAGFAVFRLFASSAISMIFSRVRSCR